MGFSDFTSTMNHLRLVLVLSYFNLMLFYTSNPLRQREIIHLVFPEYFTNQSVFPQFSHQYCIFAHIASTHK